MKLISDNTLRKIDRALGAIQGAVAVFDDDKLSEVVGEALGVIDALLMEKKHNDLIGADGFCS